MRSIINYIFLSKSYSFFDCFGITLCALCLADGQIIEGFTVAALFALTDHFFIEGKREGSK